MRKLLVLALLVTASLLAAAPAMAEGETVKVTSVTCSGVTVEGGGYTRRTGPHGCRQSPPGRRSHHGPYDRSCWRPRLLGTSDPEVRWSGSGWHLHRGGVHPWPWTARNSD